MHVCTAVCCGIQIKKSSDGEEEYLESSGHSSSLTQLYVRVVPRVMGPLNTGQTFRLLMCHSPRVCSSQGLCTFEGYICIPIRCQLKISPSVVGFRTGVRMRVPAPSSSKLTRCAGTSFQ